MQQIELQAGHQLGQIPGFIAIGSLGAVMLGISLYSRAKLVKNTHDFVIAGRKLGFGFGVAGLVSVWTWVVGILMPAAVTYSFGLSGLWWFTVPNGLAVVAVVPFARKLKRLMPHGYTISEFASVRFGGNKLATIVAISGIHGAVFRPKPISQPGPEIFQGGNSKAARRMAGVHSDWYFLNGNSIEGAKEQIDEVKSIAASHQRQVRFGLNAFIILRDSVEEALAQKQAIIDAADPESIQAFANQAKNAGQSTKEKQGMWANSDYADLVQPNDGFKTGLLGPADLIVERIKLYRQIGIDLLLTAFLHFNDELEEFGHQVITQFKREQTKVTLPVPDRRALREPSVPMEDALACGYETATETRKAQEQAIASAEQTVT